MHEGRSFRKRHVDWLVLLPSLVLWVLLLAVANAEATDRAPVLLRGPKLTTPIETAGTGLAPEVKVRVETDTRGRVTEVVVLDVKPSSEFDELFKATTREQISYWRYAPRLQAGEAVAATLEWTVKFLAQDQRDSSTQDSWGLRLSTHQRGGAEAQRARIVGLPLAQRKAVLEREAKVAEKHLDRAHRKRFDSPRFVVITDSQEPRVAEITAGNLEAIFNIIQGLFGTRIAPQPEPYKIVVYIYGTGSAFNAMKSELSLYEWSSGFYSPAGLVAFSLQAASSEDLLGTMMHEATHAWVDRNLMAPGSYLPRWLGEGFAEYLGNSEIRKGQLIPGKTAKEKFVLRMGYGPVRSLPLARANLEEVKRRIRRGDGLSVEQLMTAGAETFYGDLRALFYPSAWLLVHFLRHGEESWAEQEFPDFMLYVAEGYPASTALETVYGVSPAALEERFRSYVQKQF